MVALVKVILRSRNRKPIDKSFIANTSAESIAFISIRIALKNQHNQIMPASITSPQDLMFQLPRFRFSSPELQNQSSVHFLSSSPTRVHCDGVLTLVFVTVSVCNGTYMS